MAKAWNIKCKNSAQKEALEALMNPEIDLVILEGIAGSGKTFLTIAAGLEQTIEKKNYSKIIFTRAPVAVGFDMGHLPGDIVEKMRPWLGALMDNLEALAVDEKDVDKYMELVAIMHLRGRSFTRRWLVIDEATNITPEEMKTIITRAGENTKVVIMGDLGQIDNKKLNRDYNGLAHLIKAAASYPSARVIHLPAGVRSPLATWGAENL